MLNSADAPERRSLRRQGSLQRVTQSFSDITPSTDERIAASALDAAPAAEDAVAAESNSAEATSWPQQRSLRRQGSSIRTSRTSGSSMWPLRRKSSVLAGESSRRKSCTVGGEAPDDELADPSQDPVQDTFLGVLEG